jgi:hypothetical protein
LVATSYLEFPYLRLKLDSNFNVLDSITPGRLRQRSLVVDSLSIDGNHKAVENSEIFMSDNAKNKLKELLDNLGCAGNCIDFQSTPLAGLHSSTVTVTFPDGRIVRGTGKGHRKSDADIAAAKDALDRVEQLYPYLLVNWDKLDIEAQAGDALIKLGVYLSPESKSAEDNSNRLKNIENNAHLAKVFDRWKAQNDPRLAIWGTNLNEHRKATLVEALLLQSYGQQVIADNAPAQLADLLSILLVPDS